MSQRISYETFLATPDLASIMPDHLIRKHIGIKPYVQQQVKEEGGKKVISYGESSYGYDIRLGYEFRIFSPVSCNEIDPKNYSAHTMVAVNLVEPAWKHKWEPLKANPRWHICSACGEKVSSVEAYGQNKCPAAGETNVELGKEYSILIPPNSFALGVSLEEFAIPRDVLAVCLGKSTYARCGLIVNVTPAEPEWTGKLTIELSNTAPLSVRVYAGEGIAQLLFFRGLDTCEVSYADRKGKYQDQKELTPAKV